MVDTIYKQQLVEIIAKKEGWSQKKAEIAVNVVTNAIARSLSQEKRVTITRFGTFELRNTPARRIRGIGGKVQGQLISVPAGRRVAFRPGTELSDLARAQ